MPVLLFLIGYMSHHPHPLAQPRKPQGQPTRGKTARNRLRRVDQFLLRYGRHLLRRSDDEYDGALFVDLGYGAEPFTTLESAGRFRRLQPDLPVLGVEIDPERVTAALPYADEKTFFRLGGFNLPLLRGVDGRLERVRLIRAFNVLRQYDEEQVAASYRQMERGVLPGGLRGQGTSDPFGRIWVAHVLRLEQNWRPEALVFSTNFRTGFDPVDFQTVLPKNLIHHMVAGEPIDDFFQTWKRAVQRTAAMREWGLRQWFAASALQLAEAGYRINRRMGWLRRGYLIWQQGEGAGQRWLYSP